MCWGMAVLGYEGDILLCQGMRMMLFCAGVRQCRGMMMVSFCAGVWQCRGMRVMLFCAAVWHDTRRQFAAAYEDSRVEPSDFWVLCLIVVDGIRLLLWCLVPAISYR